MHEYLFTTGESKNIEKQECLPVGCVPPFLYHVGRSPVQGEVSVQGDLCPEDLCPGVSVQEDLCQWGVSVHRVSVSGGEGSLFRDSLSGRVSVQ